jgi:hypothetical protein
MTRDAAIGLYDCSGLSIASSIPLSAPPSGIGDPALADVVIELGEEIDQPFERPSAVLVAELAFKSYVGYTICRVGDGYVVRLPWIADFVIDADLRHVTCHPAKSDRNVVIPIIISGTITAFLLAMRGQFVLHGSAVEVNGKGLAFVGASGQGKSTMAAVMCAAGAQLVTDDIMPVAYGTNVAGANRVFAVRSGQEIRLREGAASLSEGFGEGMIRITEDDRHAVTPKLSGLERVEISAIVLPRPDRVQSELNARKLSSGEASLALGRCERIEGWRDAGHLRMQFHEIGRIVSSVPVFEVSVPWGPPFADDLASRLLLECGLEEMELAITRTLTS